MKKKALAFKVASCLVGIPLSFLPNHLKEKGFLNSFIPADTSKDFQFPKGRKTISFKNILKNPHRALSRANTRAKLDLYRGMSEQQKLQLNALLKSLREK